MRQAREGSFLSEQKNMAAADAVRGAMWALEKVLAGADGPAEIIEGKHGFVAQMSGELEPGAFDGWRVEAQSWLERTNETFPHEARADAAGLAEFVFPGFVHVDWLRFGPA